jgi:asparagine N-glycosylation enzyme membrane subunit Stt3
MSDPAEEKPVRGRPLWLLVPAIAFAGLALELAAPVPLIGSMTPGMLGCVVASVVLAILALRSTKKDIVSICIPLVSVYMFIIFPDPESGMSFVWQAIFAVSISILAVRFGLMYDQ